MRNKAQEAAEGVDEKEEIVSPIYHDTKGEVFYYPKASLKDNKEREIVDIKRGLDFDACKQSYVAPGSKEEYILVKSESEFQLRKAESMDKRGKIYYDDGKEVYFYPLEALNSPDEMALEMIIGPAPLR